jgi:AraC-like DNA-binding protein
MEKKQHLVSDGGTRDSITWEFDGIRMGHAISKFKEYTQFADELGYYTPQHFNNAFKRRFGSTPDLIRKNP